MPTGYTNGILTGEITSFEEFAKTCSRAFMIHLRDEAMDSEYKKREPSNYHLEEINKAGIELNKAKSLSDEEIVDSKRERLIESKKYHLESIEKIKSDRSKMHAFLEAAKAYKPPTKDHNGIAGFMVDQLEKTIDFDCDPSYHLKNLKDIDSKIDNIDADSVRSEMQAKAMKDLSYHTNEHEEELKRCADQNKWYSDFINSL